MGRQKELETEIDSLKDRLESSQRAWTAMRRELDEHKTHRTLEQDRDRLSAAVDCQAKAFKDCLARMLSDGCVSVQPYEEHIRERVHSIIIALQEKTAVRYFNFSSTEGDTVTMYEHSDSVSLW